MLASLAGRRQNVLSGVDQPVVSLPDNVKCKDGCAGSTFSNWKFLSASERTSAGSES